MPSEKHYRYHQINKLFVPQDHYHIELCTKNSHPPPPRQYSLFNAYMHCSVGVPSAANISPCLRSKVLLDYDINLMSLIPQSVKIKLSLWKILQLFSNPPTPDCQKRCHLVNLYLLLAFIVTCYARFTQSADKSWTCIWL